MKSVLKFILPPGLQISFLLGCLALSPAHSTSHSSSLVSSGSSSGSASGSGLQAATTPPVVRTAPLLDPLTGIVHSTLLRSGVPLGGIGTGSFQLRTDGTVGQAALRGMTQRSLTEAPGCFAALWTRTERGTTAKTLALASAYHLPTVATLDYDGLFPQANLSFPDPQSPVQTNLLAFSPLVPFDLKNSSFPAVAYVLRLKNSSQDPVEVSVALSWENLLAHASDTISKGSSAATTKLSLNTAGTATIIPSNGGYFGATFSPTGSEDAMTLLAYPDRAETIVTTTLWDAADPTPAWWERFAREGTVADPQNPMPANTSNAQRPTPNAPTPNAPTPNAQRPTPTNTPSLSLRRPGAVVAMHLVLKPGELVELPFAVSWYVKHQYGPSGVDVGHYYEVAFTGAEDAGRQLLADWRSLYGLTEEWQKRLMFSNLPRWSARRMIDAAAPLATNTIHTRDGRFTFQNRVQNAMEQSSTDAGPLASSPAASSTAPSQTDSSDPLWMERQEERLDTRSHEAIEPLLLTLYPQLAAQELTQLSALLDSKGLLPPPASADWFARLGPAYPKRLPSVPTLPPVADASMSAMIPPARVVPALDPLDANADYLIAMTRFALWTGDLDFIKPHTSEFQHAARALLGLRTASSANNPASADAASRGTDASRPALNPASFSHWLAAVRASQRLAGLLGDTVLERQCADAARDGGTQMDSSLWNGEFYSLPSLSNGQPFAGQQNGSPAPESVCSSDQLWGQWIAYQLGLGPLLPTAHLQRAAQSIQQRNDKMSANLTPSTSTSASVPGPIPFSFSFQWQVRTDGKPLATADGAASACLLPASVLSDASVALWQNQPEVAMAQLLGLENLRNNQLRSPWQYPVLLAISPDLTPNAGQKIESEASSTSLAVASDWSILYALQGFSLDINRGELALTPHLPGYWQTFNTPVFAPTFWGRMEYHPTAHGGTLTFRLDRIIGFIATPAQTLLKNRAELTLQTLRVPGPPPAGKIPPTTITAHVSHGRNPLGCRATLDPDGAVTIFFDSPLTMTAGDRLQVDIR